jgi:hypothetical protein
MKVVNSSLFINIENKIVCGDGSFKATVEHQVVVGENGVDLEFSDIRDITFMGMPVEGYKAYNQFKTKMSEMGIDIEAMVDEECVGIISNEFIEKCKNAFKLIQL